MSRIQRVFSKDHTALIAYVTTGYPDLDATLETVPMLAENGCDIIELGIPFSDPLADGVTIQNSSFHALENGVTVTACLETARTLREKTDKPLVFMTYINPVYHYGIGKFCRDSAEAGIDGLIIPDLPPEEGAELEETSLKYGIDLIYLLAPTSNDERIRLVTEHSRGFVYLVSVTGVTGAPSMVADDLESFIGRVRKVSDKPLCVGFGISTPEQAAQVGGMADGVIIGSRIIQYMESDSHAELGAFISGVRQILDRKPN